MVVGFVDSGAGDQCGASWRLYVNETVLERANLGGVSRKSLPSAIFKYEIRFVHGTCVVALRRRVSLLFAGLFFAFERGPDSLHQCLIFPGG